MAESTNPKTEQENPVESVAEVAEEVQDAAAEVTEGAVEVTESATEEVVEAVSEVVAEAEEAVAEVAEDVITEVAEDTVSVAEVADSVVSEAEDVISQEEASAEEAVDAVAEVEETTAEEVSDDVAEDSGDAAEDASLTLDEMFEEVEGVADIEHKIGYKGEILGDVYRLEDLGDSMDDADLEATNAFAALLEKFEETHRNVVENEIVTGQIVAINDKDVVIDIGFKSDGVVPRNEFTEEIAAGDDVEVYLERLEDRQGQLILSRRRAIELQRWQRIEDAFENDSVVEGTIIRRIKGGMIVDLFGKEAFLPGSQIDVRPVRDFDAYLERRMEFKVVKLNPTNGNVVVSHKALIEKDLESQRRDILSKMEPGQVLEGIVKNITDFGVFIDLGGVDGLLHITDLSWGRVSHPSEIVELDQKLNVVVLDYDQERQRISLGLKQLQPHPWDTIADRYTEDLLVEGKVVSITDYGAFVELEKGIEGLVHISEMSWTQHIKHPTQVVQMGEVVKVKILNIDREGRKISLGMKQLMEDPWASIAERFPPGTVTKGVVRNLTNFGIFVEIEPGIDGLVHVSDLSWTKKVRHPGEVVRKGQEIDVKVLDLDEESRRLSLGHKQVETNPWNQFASAYPVDAIVEATVLRFNESGVVVLLPMDVEAFIPASHLNKGGAALENAYKVGDKLEAKVIEFSRQDKRIILSEKAVTEAEESIAVAKEEAAERAVKVKERSEIDTYMSSQDATGPATLGELSALANLKAEVEAAEALVEAETPEVVAEAAEDAAEAAGETVAATVEETTESVEETVADAVETTEETVAETTEEVVEAIEATVTETEEVVAEEAAEVTEDATEVVEAVSETVEESSVESEDNEEK